VRSRCPGRRPGTVPMSQVILAHREADGSIGYFSTIARDLSREKELEDQFRQAQKMEALGRLAGGVAHDFNNLLSAIMGFTEMAKQDLESGHRARLALNEVHRTAEQAAALTGQLLAFGRKQTLQPRIIDVSKTLGEMKPMLERLIDQSIQLRIMLSRDPVSIKADPNQIQQILLNLVVNARDAMPQGGQLTISSTRVTLDDGEATSRLQLNPGSYALIAVSDTGHGMTADVRSRVFEPFFTTKDPGKGTGLGLSTVFGIVRQSGGSVWLCSEPGRGTTFKIYLPCGFEAVAAQPPTA
ncbi:MAG: sensor histidine kinase, partial [Anaerolineae bacterium]